MINYSLETEIIMSKIIIALLLSLFIIVIPLGIYIYKLSLQSNTNILRQAQITPTNFPTRESNIYKSKSSDTDLSYIVVYGEDYTQIELLNSNNNPVGQSFIQQPLVDDVDKKSTSGHPLIVFYFAKPSNGQYKLSVKSDKEYQLEIFIYDRDGNVTRNNFVGKRGDNLYLIEFNKNNLKESKISPL